MRDARAALKAQADASLYFFAKVVLGFRDMSEEIHYDYCAFLERPDRFKLVELPRGFLKTHIGAIAYPLWRLTQNPNLRVLVASATATNAEKILGVMAKIVEGNGLFRWLYEDLIPDFLSVTWTKTALELRRTGVFPEASIEAIGTGGTAVSRHYDLIIKDDLVNEDHLLSHEQMAKVIDWHKYSAGLFVNPAKGEDLVIGSRWDFGDVISYVKEHQPYYASFFHPIVEGGQPTWPERFPQAVIDYLLDLEGPRIFSAQRMLNPVHENPRAFDPAWFRRFTHVPPGPIRYVAAVDPAIATSRGSDYSAIVVVGTTPAYERYVVEARHGRWGVDELIDHLFEVYRTWTPVSVGIETVAFQRLLLYPIREAMRREDLTFPITSLTGGNARGAKAARIESLQEFFNNGSLWIRTGLDDLVRELTEHPVGQHQDLADALAFAIQMSRPASKTPTANDNPFLLENVLETLRGRAAGQRLWTWHETPAGVA